MVSDTPLLQDSAMTASTSAACANGNTGTSISNGSGMYDIGRPESVCYNVRQGADTVASI